MRHRGPTRRMSSTRTKSAADSHATCGEELGTERSILRPAKSGGREGYSGYDYQKLVTVWLSLELMIAKELAETITVEPRSQEDIEAAVRVPAEGSLRVSTEPYQLTVQVKSRSTAPWTSAAFAKVLKCDTEKGETAGRARPLDMLRADPRARYLFVTNEAVDSSLRPHVTESLLDFPDAKELPPHTRRGIDGRTRATLSSRLAILSGLTREILDDRIRRALETHCHVPVTNHPACVVELREAIHERMLGGHGGRFRKDELLRVLAEHGGSVLPTRRMDHYVRPRSYEQIEQSLDERHAVIIAGPSGTGKTLTAEILELAYRRSNPPYQIMGSENGPGPIRSRLINPHPALFHLRDPWGSNRLTPEAEPWANELPKLLTQANASHKFLVTSRSDVLQSAGVELKKKLGPYVVQIEIEDYGFDRLAEIYDRIRGDLSGHAAELARQHRSAALEVLTRPYELDRFLVSLSAQHAKKPQKVNLILKASQIDAISSVVADQVKGRGKEGVAAAAILWAMLQARETLTIDMVHRIGRLLRAVAPAMRPDLEGMVDFLVAGRNLRRESETITFYHPRVEDGLRMVIEAQRNETEYVLSCLADGLAKADEDGQDWGIETALGVLESVSQLKAYSLSLAKETQSRLDKFLENSLLSATKISSIDRVFQNLARFGSKSHVPSTIARILVGDRDDEDDDWSFGRFWKAPSVAAHTLEKVRGFSKTPTILGLFIQEVLPFSRTHYRDTLVPLLYSFASGLNSDFRNAVEIVAEPGGPIENIGVVAQGACYGDQADFDWVIQQFVVCEHKADAWWKKFQPTYYKAEEHVFDAAHADHIVEQPQEQFYNSSEGLEIAVALRFRKEGIAWLALHKDRELLASRLTEFLRKSKEHVPVEVLRALIECANGSARTSVWSLVENNWDESLQDLLRKSLLSVDLEDEALRQALVRVAALSSRGLDKVLAELMPQMSSARRLEILYDLMETTIEDGARGKSEETKKRSRAEFLAALLAERERELGLAMIAALAGANPRRIATGLSPDALSELRSRLLDAPASISGVLACLASGARLDVGSVTDRLLRGGSVGQGIAAIRSLAMQASVRQILSALKHPRYPVRCEALRVLAGLLKKGERSVLLESARDPAADVRLTWARLMETLCWPEAIPPLVELLKDQRNFSSDYGVVDGPVWSEFRVARAAARSLGAFGELPRGALDAVMAAAVAANADPFVPCACLSAIAKKDDPRITAVLLNSLAVQGLKGSREHRPLAQAGGWALFDRALAGKLDGEGIDLTFATLDSNPAIAAPALLATSYASARNSQNVLAKLEAENLPYRVELLCAAAATLRETLLEGATERDRSLASLASGKTLQELGEPGEALKAWSQSLEVERDVQGYTSWLVKTALRLPVKEAIEDPRKFDLPERIGVFTMRSLSPARETGRTSPDDGL
jgi:hypothetical protein